MRYRSLLILALLVGCAANDGVQHGGAGSDANVKDKSETATPEKDAAQLDEAAARARRASLPTGMLDIDITNVLGERLPARVDLLCYEDSLTTLLEVPNGVLESAQPVGSYRAYVHVLDSSVPVMVEVQEITVTADRPAYLLVNLLEGAGGVMALRSFDSDGDLALDRVELKMGTDPYNAGSIPGRAELAIDSRALKQETRWYRGELHAYSQYGGGKESVAELVRRAEKSGLEFLAITDRNTLAATTDPGFRSDKLALLPAMEWGTDEDGVALIYGPRTTPDAPTTQLQAQAECIRVQAQGGAWIVAHPAFPSKPWQWGLSFVNGVEVWFRDWRGTPPLSLKHLKEQTTLRDQEKQLVHSIAAAAALSEQAPVSSNAQNNQFYDYELVRGLMGSAIGGSGSGSEAVPLGRPVTYIHARELSVPALLEGLRLGRTYVSEGLDGPKLYFGVDVLGDGKVDVGIGGVMPINIEATFEVAVSNAVGKKLQVIENGRPIRTIPINDKETAIRFKRMISTEAAYRVRIISSGDPKTGFGPLEVHALTSPIYARDITQELLMRNPNFDPDKSWVRIQQNEGIRVQVEPDIPENINPQSVPQW